MHDPLHRTFSAPCFIPFCSYWYASPRDLHSFPTRRSSDLGVLLSLQGGSDMGLFEINEAARLVQEAAHPEAKDRKSTRLNSSHVAISYAVFCLKKKKTNCDNRRGMVVIAVNDEEHPQPGGK